MKIDLNKTIYPVFFNYFRTRRMKKFTNHFHVNKSTRILDVGGTPFNWNLIQLKPRLFFCNISMQDTGDLPNWVIADGKNLPFADQSFDIVYSNSVIEHLGNKTLQAKFASEAQRVGINYYIQTPNKWFPIEPHYLAPFIHWLPKSIQMKLLRNFTLRGLLTRPSQAECKGFVEEIRLLDKDELKILFPDGEIWIERFLSLPKSLLAVRVNKDPKI
jgi:hypothetical protein